MTTYQPWWTFPRIDNFGTIDPAGPYWKPDSNIQLPGFYPITALLSGTVTNVQQTNWGQTVVTVALDQPLNSEATHTFYEHMSSSSVSVGQHVNAGDLIGYNNPAGQVPLGFGLYSGDVYGSGSAWTQLQSDLAPGGPGLLNPVNLLNAAKDNNLASYVSGTSSGSATSSSSAIPGFMSALGLPSVSDVQSFAQRMGIIFIGGTLLLVGVLVLFIGPEKQAAKTSAKVAVL